jgi:enamine deaminase RidA (YjgF/YER057c/UK114 family)
MTVTRHDPTKIYSKAVEGNGFVFTAGTVAEKLSEDVRGQTRQVLAEIDRVLALAGTSKSNVVSATIWLPDIRTRDAMNEVWTEWTGGRNLPARACVEAKLADPRMLVEIAVIAVK